MHLRNPEGSTSELQGWLGLFQAEAELVHRAGNNLVVGNIMCVLVVEEYWTLEEQRRAGFNIRGSRKGRK